MSENPNLDTRDLTNYDTMATEDLRQILRQDADAPADQKQDTELLYYIMGLLAQREQDSGVPNKTPEEAWDTFLEHYLPCEEEIPEVPCPQKKHRVRWHLQIGTVAAVLALVLCITLRADAFGFNYKRIIGTWTDDNFNLVNLDETNPDSPLPADPASYTELQRLLAQAGMDPNLAPTWIPEGFEMTNATIDSRIGQNALTVEYQNGDRFLGFLAQTYLPDETRAFERSDGPTEIIQRGDVTYYLFPNLDAQCAVWVKDSWQCSVWGYVTREEMKQIIQSIPEGE